ncbi:DegT/DnrJ/EryC1/StrS family aminotransferase [Erythrobacter litoralis]|uniref:Putative eps aminotransferase protein n=1 Tax=Erythrobacter litoralis (strain HTCC2594) TaxID=314225 RepID=Q2N6D8_ERYLH|nr:DegT/DnrJ/EryC1/StrS aminotransferase family protein [Erythrobacter litoralis]ABC64753.1 putative eps aminotransferase protein [Erythrobacter litoralis HTCC2594]
MSPWPSFSEEEVAAVAKTLASNKVNYWTGQQGREFERRFAEWSGTAHAIAVTNGTVALDLPLTCMDIGPGDEVIVTPRSFIASVSSVVNVGATPVFADVDPDSGNLSAATIEAVLTSKTKAIVPVHLGGWPCDMEDIVALARARGIKVIEDCAQAHGARIAGKMVGGFGDAGAWSFCQDKIMTTGGEGGMVTTDDAALYEKMWSYKDHGKNWDAVYNRDHAPGFRWVHESFGTNWRMLEMQAAVGLLQLGYMPTWTERRTAIANQIAETLAVHADVVRCPLPDADRVTHAFYRLYAYVREEALAPGWSRDRIVAETNALGAPLLHGTCSEIYLEKAFDNTGWRPAERLPNARTLGETSLMFLTHPTLTNEEIDHVCQAVGNVLAQARR